MQWTERDYNPTYLIVSGNISWYERLNWLQVWIFRSQGFSVKRLG